MPNVPSGVPITDNLPQGLDRADGQSGRLGQSTTGLSMQVNGQSYTDTLLTPLNEAADSPTIERAEQCTVRHRYVTNPSDALTRWALYPRGTLVTDSFNNYYRVLSCTYNRLKGDEVALDIVSEAMSFDNPPDEFCCNPVNLGLDIMKHPRYFYALMPTNQIPGFTGTPDSSDESTAKQTIVRAIQAYRENPWIPTTDAVDNISGLLHDNIAISFANGKITTLKRCPNWDSTIPTTDPTPIGGTPPAVPVAGNNPKFQYVIIDTAASTSLSMAMAAAKELIQKLWRCEDTPMVNGIEITWSQYYWRPPYLNLGGYIEDPIAAGLPDYFYSPSNPPNTGTTIFDILCQLNPQCYSSNGTGNFGTTSISWLRCADVLEYQRTWFKVTRKWLGAPIGSWDVDIYGVHQRPQVPTDYRPLTIS